MQKIKNKQCIIVMPVFTDINKTDKNNESVYFGKIIIK